MSTVSYDSPWTTIATYDIGDAFFPSGQWRPTKRLTVARCSWEMAVELGALSMVPALQFADDVTDPAGFTNQIIGTAKTAVRVHDPTAYTVVGTNADGNRFFRTGWMAHSVVDDTDASARVGGLWEVGYG